MLNVCVYVCVCLSAKKDNHEFVIEIWIINLNIMFCNCAENVETNLGTSDINVTKEKKNQRRKTNDA